MWGDLKMDRMMTLAEVEQCEQAYIVYEPDDYDARLFRRKCTDDENILFERDIGRFIKSQPYMRKEMYGIVWFAFAEKPRKVTIDNLREKIKNHIRTEMPWLREVYDI